MRSTICIKTNNVNGMGQLSNMLLPKIRAVLNFQVRAHTHKHTDKHACMDTNIHAHTHASTHIHTSIVLL